MIKVKVISFVNFNGMKIKDEYIQEYDDNENVFGRILLYHQRMQKVFPNCDFELIEAREIK